MKQLYLLLIILLVSLSAYAEKSGTCGDNLQWKLTDEGVLTITGTGEMQDWGGRILVHGHHTVMLSKL